MERIETNDASNSAWEMMNETFPTSEKIQLMNPAVVQHENCILVMGGRGGNYEMQLRNVSCVDTEVGTISDAGLLAYSVERSAFIKIDYAIYLFGGVGGLPVMGSVDYLTTWQYYTLPTPGPTHEPTDEPTADPTDGPTADPTSDPSNDPTSDPTADPTGDPTVDPTSDPTMDPTLDPTPDPTDDPTTNPTIEPTEYPTDSPTDSPTDNPTKAPLPLFDFLKQNTDQSLDKSANIMLITAVAFGMIVILCAFVVMKIFKMSQKRMMVDDQDYKAAAVYIAQIVDIFSDLVFSLQCRAYWLYEDEDPNDVVKKGTFSWIYHCALGFTIAPYLMNLFSSINITKTIPRRVNNISKTIPIFILC